MFTQTTQELELIFAKNISLIYQAIYKTIKKLVNIQTSHQETITTGKNISELGEGKEMDTRSERA
jgi:hypothetical protein